MNVYCTGVGSPTSNTNTAQGGSRCSLPMDANTDRIGNDYSQTTMSGPEECCLACQNDSRCQAYTWFDAGRTCYLKSPAPQRTAAQRNTSGAKPVPKK